MPVPILRRLAPGLFVVLWSTGFVVARLVTPHVGPLTFLTARFGLAALLMGAGAFALRAPWPRTARAWRDAVGIGLLTQAFYLSPVFWAVSRGLPSGVAALIAATQPLLTAVLAGRLLGERVGGRKAGGIAIGFIGVAAVLAPKIAGAGAYPPLGVGVALGGVVAITLGTIWQKRLVAPPDIRTAVPIQFGASGLATLVLALGTEDGHLDPSPELWLGLAWSVVVLSIGTVSLYFWLLQRGGAVGVASTLFLVPPVTSVMALALFDEALSPVQWAGMAIAGIGVALATRPD